MKKGIHFYESDDHKSSDLIKLDNSDEEIYEIINMPRYFLENLKNMINKLGFPTRMSWLNKCFAKICRTHHKKRVMLPNGMTMHSRGLGYHQPKNMLTNVWNRTKSDILHFKLANSSKSKNFAREGCQSNISYDILTS